MERTPLQELRAALAEVSAARSALQRQRIFLRFVPSHAKDETRAAIHKGYDAAIAAAKLSMERCLTERIG